MGSFFSDGLLKRRCRLTAWGRVPGTPRPAPVMPSTKRALKPSPTPSIAVSASLADGAAADPGRRVLRQFRQIFSAVRAHFRAVEKRVGLGGAQVWALSIVADRPGIGVGGLARAMDIHQSTASNLVRVLVRSGLLLAERSGSDRRAVELRLLPAGSRVLRNAPAPHAGVLPQALGQLDTLTLERLEGDLAELIAVLGVDARDANAPLGGD